ncbi:MAG: Fructokinase [Anaerolineae bacterium]|nr:Fructokinase [Anaerolineae bacterium]
MDIVCLGELLIDMFPAEVGRRLVEVSAFHPKPGGAPANVAVAAARLGAASAFIGKVGDDAFGHYLRETLATEGVETRGIRFDADARTTLVFVALIDENTPEFIFYRNPGADMRLRADELDADLLRQAKVFHFGSISLINEPSRSATLAAVELAREAGALVSFDVNYRPALWPSPAEAAGVMRTMLPRADLVKVNDAELELLTGSRDLAAGSQKLLDSGPALVVVTLGPAGSYFYAAGGGAHVPGFAVPTVDGVGCGDAFTAGLLTQLIAGGDWRARLEPSILSRILRYANAVGALTATKQGVIPALPTAADVATFLTATA